MQAACTLCCTGQPITSHLPLTFEVWEDATVQDCWKLSDMLAWVQISRQLAQESTSVKMTGKDSYALKVFPGMDCAFMVALVTIVDELFYD